MYHLFESELCRTVWETIHGRWGKNLFFLRIQVVASGIVHMHQKSTWQKFQEFEALLVGRFFLSSFYREMAKITKETGKNRKSSISSQKALSCELLHHCYPIDYNGILKHFG